MSKSTPINQLPTNNSENVNNSNESELVQEILKEIEDTQNLELNNPIVENSEVPNVNMNIEATEPQMPPVNQIPSMEPLQNMQNMQSIQQMNPMQMNPMQMNQMQMNQMQMNQMPMQNMDMMENNTNVVEYKSSIEKLMESLKLPAIVAMITILLSIPQLKNLIKRMIPEKFVAMGMGLTLNILLRGVLSGVLFYGANLVV
jgi:hypothetical protein